MRKTRCLIAAALLATALCADRAVAAAPALQPQAIQLAQRLVSRLSSSFRRTVPTACFAELRRHSQPVICLPIAASTEAPNSPAVTPFHLGLPPPTA